MSVLENSVSVFLSTAVGVLFGGLITLFVSHYYYRRGSEDFRREADSLRSETERLRGYLHMTLRVLQALSGGHDFIIRYNDQGEPVRVAYRVGIDAQSSSATQVGVEDHADPADPITPDSHTPLERERPWWRRLFGE